MGQSHRTLASSLLLNIIWAVIHPLPQNLTPAISSALTRHSFDILSTPTADDAPLNYIESQCSPNVCRTAAFLIAVR
jgi:hypothetical protein